MRPATVMLCSFLLLSFVLHFNTWTRFSSLRGVAAYKNALAFTDQIASGRLVATHCEDWSLSASGIDCSVIVDAKPVFFRCDERECFPTCAGEKP